jgi:hypothetical protein
VEVVEEVDLEVYEYASGRLGLEWERDTAGEYAV